MPPVHQHSPTISLFNNRGGVPELRLLSCFPCPSYTWDVRGGAGPRGEGAALPSASLCPRRSGGRSCTLQPCVSRTQKPWAERGREREDGNLSFRWVHGFRTRPGSLSGLYVRKRNSQFGKFLFAAAESTTPLTSPPRSSFRSWSQSVH